MRIKIWQLKMKTRSKIIIIVIAIFSILFVPPNVAAFTCNTLEIKDIQCHVIGMSFFGMQFKTNIYEWYGWTDTYTCGGVLAHPDKGYNCMGIEDYWGLPPEFSSNAERERYEKQITLFEITDNNVMGNKTLEISGWTIKANSEVILTISAPNGNVITTDNVTPKIDGYFSTVITTGGPLWKQQDGIYAITVQQLDSSDTTFELVLRDGNIIFNGCVKTTFPDGSKILECEQK